MPNLMLAGSIGIGASVGVGGRSREAPRRLLSTDVVETRSVKTGRGGGRTLIRSFQTAHSNFLNVPAVIRPAVCLSLPRPQLDNAAFRGCALLLQNANTAKRQQRRFGSIRQAAAPSMCPRRTAAGRGHIVSAHDILTFSSGRNRRTTVGAASPTVDYRPPSASPFRHRCRMKLSLYHSIWVLVHVYSGSPRLPRRDVNSTPYNDVASNSNLAPNVTSSASVLYRLCNFVNNCISLWQLSLIHI